MLGGPPDATPSPAYLGMPLQPEPTTALFTLCYNAAHGNYFTNLQKGGWGGPPTPPAQRASTSESCACTSMASCGHPSTCGVECAGEWPPTVVSESDHGSSKARGCSSSIMDPHSRNYPCGLASSPFQVGGVLLFPFFCLLMFIPLWLIFFLLHLLIVFL